MKPVLASLLVILCCTTCQKPTNSNFEVSIQKPTGRLLRGDTLSFSVEVSGDVNKSSLSYIWQFGDSSSSPDSSPRHTFHRPGSVRVILTARAEDGVSRTDTVVLNIAQSLKLLSKTTLTIDEPSGLTLSLDRQSLWVVSDYSNESIKRFSLDGQDLQSFNSRLGGDLEGVVVTPDNHLWVVQENTGWLIEMDTTGTILDTIQIDLVTHGSGGLEGLTYNPDNHSFYLIKEKDPSVLIVLDSTFTTTLYKRVGFAADLSGLCYVPGRASLFAVSHEESMVYELDLEGNVLHEFGVKLPQVEGVAFDEGTSIFYLVDDSVNKLFSYTYWD